MEMVCSSVPLSCAINGCSLYEAEAQPVHRTEGHRRSAPSAAAHGRTGEVYIKAGKRRSLSSRLAYLLARQLR